VFFSSVTANEACEMFVLWTSDSRRTIMQFTRRNYTAIVTPFTQTDAFDEQAFRRLIDFQVDLPGAAGPAW